MKLDRERLADADKIDWSDLPYCMKAGRYAFFGLCAWCVSVNAGVLVLVTTEVKLLSDLTGYAALIVTFMTLRDMSKAWDYALTKQAEYRAAMLDAAKGEG